MSVRRRRRMRRRDGGVNAGRAGRSEMYVGAGVGGWS
jgi:hypothetical protein